MDNKEEFKERFAYTVLNEMTENNLSQKDLAKETGIPEANISGYLRQRGLHYTECGIFNLVKISEVLGVTTDYLLGLSKVKRPDTNLSFDIINRTTALSEEAINAICKLNAVNERINANTFRKREEYRTELVSSDSSTLGSQAQSKSFALSNKTTLSLLLENKDFFIMLTDLDELRAKYVYYLKKCPVLAQEEKDYHFLSDWMRDLRYMYLDICDMFSTVLRSLLKFDEEYAEYRRYENQEEGAANGNDNETE